MTLAAGVIVPGWGPSPARVAVIGERPGEEEGHTRRPFVGRSGREQRAHFARNGINVDDCWVDNLCRDYQPGNPAPEPEDIAHWGPILLETIRRVNPKFIVAAGAMATRFFLGQSAYLEAFHGIAHRWSDNGGPERTVIPVYHPAAHFYQPDLLPFITSDYARAAGFIKGKIPVDPPHDDFPDPQYSVCTSRGKWEGTIALDSEGVPGQVFSFQVTSRPGQSYVYLGGIPRIARGSLVVMHSAMYEIEMAHSLGVDLLDPHRELTFFDTQMAAYLLRIEPQSLKNLARRWCGMEMKEYREVVGAAGLQKQLDYLSRVTERSWPKPEPRVEYENNGSAHVYTPQPVERRAEAILLDVYGGKLDKEGNPADPLKRWRKVDRTLRLMVEDALGPMPIGTLADVPLDEAVYYGGRDPDATLRVYQRLAPALESAGLSPLMDMKMRMLPAAAMMKITGVLGERAAFEALRDDMWDQMGLIRDKISRVYLGGKPFNPGSSDQVAYLMRKRGLVGAKRTATGKMSTSKKSIEHLRFEDPAIELVEQWRERQKAKDSFAEPVLENWPRNEVPRCRIRGDLKLTRVETGRFSMALLEGEPSTPLMAVPVRTEIGRMVRACYVAEEGYQLFEADLDQAEMRIMADESGDERLVKLFQEGKVDIHGDTASRIFHVPYETAMTGAGKMLYRYPAKRTGFGVITGIQGPGLFDQLRMAGCTGWDVRKVDRMIKDWFALFPGVKTYMNWCGEECARQGGVIYDRWGMPRYLPNIFSEDKYERFEAVRQAHSHRIQGGAQGWLQNVMGWLWVKLAPFGDSVRWLLQVHDSLMWEIKKGLEDIVRPIIMDGMINHGGATLKVPVRSSGIFGNRWNELKD